MNYIVQILRTLFFNIDRVVYEGVGNVYDLLLRISRATILDSATISKFYSRIYALIGIFMLFKISLSLITYILNPDEFVDKEKGFASIIKRVIISLVMLVLVPYAFREAYALQAMLLEDNTLAALVFGEINNNYQIDSAGEKMKFILMYTFFQPNYNGLYEKDAESSLPSCAITYQYDDDGMVHEENGVFTLNSECFGPLVDDLYVPPEHTYGKYWENADAKDLYQTYAQGIARQNFYLMFKHDIAMIEKKGESGLYLVDYMYPLSTAVGVAVLWVLLMFCIDVAVRSIKLAFYQLIAPVPILSYIDPKSKDGMFSKWIKQCGTTYLSLFIRLLALYLAIYLISAVTSSGIQDVVTGERITDWWVCIFVIIGVLMFAKQLPKILEESLGFKGTGDFTLNPLKKLEDGMIGGKLASGAAKRAVGTAKGLGTAALVGGAALATGQGFRLGAMGHAVLGGFRGEKFGKNFASSYGAGRARKKELDKMAADGVNPWAVRGEKIYNAFHGESHAEKVATLESQGKAIQELYKTIENQAIQCDTGADITRFNATTGRMETIRNAKTIQKELEQIEKTTIDRGQFHDTVDSSGRTITAEDQYIQAIQSQQAAIKARKDELETRVNMLAAGDADPNNASAKKVIEEATKSMQALVQKSNELGTSLDSTFKTITATGTDVVNMNKQAKGTVAQTTTGKLSDIKDRGKYADGGKK